MSAWRKAKRSPSAGGPGRGVDRRAQRVGELGLASPATAPDELVARGAADGAQRPHDPQRRRGQPSRRTSSTSRTRSGRPAWWPARQAASSSSQKNGVALGAGEDLVEQSAAGGAAEDVVEQALDLLAPEPATDSGPRCPSG
jgi:hypothetical protein